MLVISKKFYEILVYSRLLNFNVIDDFTKKQAPKCIKSGTFSDISSTILTLIFSKVDIEPLGRHVTTFCKETGMRLPLKKSKDNLGAFVNLYI